MKEEIILGSDSEAAVIAMSLQLLNIKNDQNIPYKPKPCLHRMIKIMILDL